MALFVQIDHFRKTDQKPTVKNHLFSISWFRSFNRTSFQQQLKHFWFTPAQKLNFSFNRTSFQQQLKHVAVQLFFNRGLASIVHPFNNNWNWKGLVRGTEGASASIVHPFNNNWNIEKKVEDSVKTASIVHPFNNNWNTWCASCKNLSLTLQSYILSTTTETLFRWMLSLRFVASIVHPFNNNWNLNKTGKLRDSLKLQSYIRTDAPEIEQRTTI